MSFKVGDKVIYPNQGVGVIEEVCIKSIGGSSSEFYTVRLADSDSTVLVPVNNAENIGIRSLCSEKGVEGLFEILSDDFKEPDKDWKTRYKVNLEKMNTGEITEVARVLKNLFYLSFQKNLSFREKKMFDRSRQLVISEIATVKGQTFDETEEEVYLILNQAYRRVSEEDSPQSGKEEATLG